MRVVLVISSLDIGGAERWNVNLADLLNKNGVAVTVLTYRRDKPDFYTLSEGVHRGWADFSLKGWAKIRALRATLASYSPDVVIASGNKTNIRTILAGRKQPWKTVAVEHNDPAQQPIGWKWELSRAVTYRRADALVSVSVGADRYFWFLPRRLRHVIPNTFPEHDIRKEPGEYKNIVGVGRLVPIKGFDRLIEAFARVAPRFSGWTLTLWGDGPEQERLTALSDRLGVKERVLMPGLTTEPLREIARSDVLALTSKSEGFGNVLVEAMSVGVPVVAFDCPSGPRDIIDSPESGILVPNGDIAALARALESLMSDAARREALGCGGLARAQAFSPEAHVAQWLKLLHQLVDAK